MATLKLDVNVELTPAHIAKAFCSMNDEQQAQFFIEVAEIAKSWPAGLGPGWQWWQVGRHLATCGCATEEARDVVRELFAGIKG